MNQEVIPSVKPVDIRDDELLSCPFCGSDPTIYRTAEIESVACTNPDCAVQPAAYGLLCDGRAAREVWNTRVLDQ